MAHIQYSGNADEPDSFSVEDIDTVTKLYNDTVDAIIFIMRYTGRTNRDSIDRELEYIGIGTLEHIGRFPYNKLISAVGMANDYHKQNARNSYEQFSLLSTEKIRNAVDEYEMEYSSRTHKLSQLHWSFQTDIIFAFDKLYKEVKQFRAKNEHIPSMHKALFVLRNFINGTLNIIGAPENKWFDAPLTLDMVFKIRDKLSANNTPIYPLHIYNDITRFESIKDQSIARKREHSRKQHYDNISQQLAMADDRYVELVESNRELAKRLAQKEHENEKLRQENEQLTQTIAMAKRGILGKLAFGKKQNGK